MELCDCHLQWAELVVAAPSLLLPPHCSSILTPQPLLRNLHIPAPVHPLNNLWLTQRRLHAPGTTLLFSISLPRNNDWSRKGIELDEITKRSGRAMLLKMWLPKSRFNKPHVPHTCRTLLRRTGSPISATASVLKEITHWPWRLQTQMGWVADYHLGLEHIPGQF